MGIVLPSPPCRGLVVGRSRPQGGGPPPFAPEGLFLDYSEADDLALPNATLITSWAGRNGAITLTRPGLSNLRPTFLVNSDGAGNDSVQFDGVDDSLLMDATAVAALADGTGTLLLVWETLGTTTGRFQWSLGASTTTVRFAGTRAETALLVYMRVASPVFLSFESAGANGGGADFSLFEFKLEASADASTLARFERAAGVSFDLTPAQTVVLDGLINQGSIGSLFRTTGESIFCAMRLRAWGILDRTLTAQERTDINTYLTTRWGY